MESNGLKQKASNGFIRMKNQKWTKKKIALLGIILLLLISSFFLFGGGKSDSEYIKVKEQKYAEKIVAVGQLGMENQTQIISQVSGEIDYIGAKEGETVSAGALIISIYNSEQGFQTEQKNTTYLDVKEQYKSLIEYDYILAKEDFNRAALIKQQAEKAYTDAQTLYREGAISKDSLDDYQLTYESALNQLSAANLKFQAMGPGGSKRDSLYYKLENAKSVYESAVEDESKYKIMTNWDSVILGAYVQVNDTVKPGDVLLDIGQAKSYTVIAELDEKYFLYVTKGMKVDINIEGQQGATPLKGEISIITPKINKNTGTFQIIIKLLSDIDFNASDLTVNLKIALTEKTNVIVIPDQYLIGNENFVFLYKNGKANKTEVVIERGPSSNIIVKKGLAEGDIVILPSDLIKDGASVKLKKGVEPV